MRKMYKNKQKIYCFLILLITLIIIGVVSNIFKKTTIDASLLDSKYCEKNEDCVITSRKKLDCCSVCFIEAISKEAELEREKWERLNCNREDYRYCLSAECGIVPIDFIAICINNKCDMKKRMT